MAASKYIPKYYPGDPVWCICYDANDKAYAAEGNKEEDRL